MFIVVTVVDTILEPFAIPEMALLVLLIAVGATVYVASALVLVRSTTLELFTLAMSLFRSRVGPRVNPEASVSQW